MAIPKGWKRVRTGRVRPGDKFITCDGIVWPNPHLVGHKVSGILAGVYRKPKARTKRKVG